MNQVPFIEQLTHILDRVHKTPDGALVTYALSRSAGDFVKCRCLFNSAGSIEPRPTIDYGKIVLGETWMTRDDAVAFLRGLNTGSGVNLHGVQITDSYLFQSGIAERQIASRSGLTGWPEWVFDLRRNNGPRSFPAMHEPLVGAALRPFKSTGFAIADWVWDAGTSWNGGPPVDGHSMALKSDHQRAS